DEFQHAVRQFVVCSDVEDLDNVGMLQLSNRFRFSAEATQFLRTGIRAGPDHFECHNPVEARVTRLVHDAHPAMPEFRKDLIVGELRGGRHESAVPLDTPRPLSFHPVNECRRGARTIGGCHSWYGRRIPQRCQNVWRQGQLLKGALTCSALLHVLGERCIFVRAQALRKEALHLCGVWTRIHRSRPSSFWTSFLSKSRTRLLRLYT